MEIVFIPMLPFIACMFLMGYIIMGIPLAILITVIVAKWKRLDIMKCTAIGIIFYISGVFPWVDMILRIISSRDYNFIQGCIYLLLYWCWFGLILYFSGLIFDSIDQVSKKEYTVDSLLIYTRWTTCTLAFIFSLKGLAFQEIDPYITLINWSGIRSLYIDGLIPPLYTVLPFSIFTLCIAPLSLELSLRQFELFTPWASYALHLIGILLTLSWLVFLAYSRFTRRSAGKTDNIQT